MPECPSALIAQKPMLKCPKSDQVFWVPKYLSAFLKFHIEVFYLIVMFCSWNLQLKTFTREKPLNDLLNWIQYIIESL